MPVRTIEEAPVPVTTVMAWEYTCDFCGLVAVVDHGKSSSSPPYLWASAAIGLAKMRPMGYPTEEGPGLETFREQLTSRWLASSLRFSVITTLFACSEHVHELARVASALGGHHVKSSRTRP